MLHKIGLYILKHRKFISVEKSFFSNKGLNFVGCKSVFVAFEDAKVCFFKLASFAPRETFFTTTVFSLNV